VKTKKVSAATAAPAKIAAEVESQVAVTMESLKEQIFRLELRRQAGTISEEDYEREKARVDKTLRDMVQG
jgi:SH3-like domain-containing protein